MQTSYASALELGPRLILNSESSEAIGSRVKHQRRKANQREKQNLKRFQDFFVVTKPKMVQSAAPFQSVVITEEIVFNVLQDVDLFVGAFVPAPINKTSVELITWIGINRALERLNLCSVDDAKLFYEAANEHMFHLANMAEFEEDDAEIDDATSTDPMPPADIGVEYEDLRSGKKFVNEVEIVKELSEQLKSSIESNVEHMKNYVTQVGRAAADTKLLYQQRGAAEASYTAAGKTAEEAARLAKKALQTSVKGLWAALKTLSVSDIVAICIQMFTATGQTAEAVLTPKQKECFDILTRQTESIERLANDYNVFPKINAINSVLPTWMPRIPTLQRPDGMPVQSLNEASFDDRIASLITLTNYKLFFDWRRSDEESPHTMQGDVPVENPDWAVASAAFTAAGKTTAVVTGGSSVAFQIGIMLLNVIIKAVYTLAGISKNRINEWANRNGNKVRKQRVRVLNKYVYKLGGYLDILHNDDNNAAIWAQLVDNYKRTTLPELSQNIKSANINWGSGSIAIRKSMKDYNKVFNRWFDNPKIRSGLIQMARVSLSAAESYKLVNPNLFPMGSVILGTWEAMAFALWRLTISAEIKKINDAIDITDNVYEILNKDVAATDYDGHMTPQKWTLEEEWASEAHGENDNADEVQPYQEYVDMDR
jgi:hypothetical protein